ncbi:DDE-type integrase/transposase/recombinase [Bacillus sp. OA1]|nr:DDE-type integrase/transposase/recombinase [Bacillus sp. OA1]
MYLYRAVDSDGNIIDFFLSKTRDTKSAKRFLKKALAFSYIFRPRVITVDKKLAYPEGIQIRQVRYLKNIVEQDHRFIKKRIRTILGFKSFRAATQIIVGIEAMYITQKGKTFQREKSVQNQMNFIRELFGLTAKVVFR